MRVPIDTDLLNLVDRASTRRYGAAASIQLGRNGQVKALLRESAERILAEPVAVPAPLEASNGQS